MTIEERFARLERQNRNLRRWVAGAVAIALATIVAGTVGMVKAADGTFGTIVAQKIILGASASAPRVALFMDKLGHGQVWVYDAGGGHRASVSAADGGRLWANAQVFVSASNGMSTVMNADHVTSRNIFLSDGARNRLILSGSTGQITAYDTASKPRAQIDSTGFITTQDSNGKLRTVLHSEGNFLAYDANGKLRAALYGGTGKVATYYSTGVRGAELGYDALLLYNSAGKNQTLITAAGEVALGSLPELPRIYLRSTDNKIYFKNASGQAVATHP